MCQTTVHFLSLVIGVPFFVYNVHLLFVDNVCFARSSVPNVFFMEIKLDSRV